MKLVGLKFDGSLQEECQHQSLHYVKGVFTKNLLKKAEMDGHACNRKHDTLLYAT